MNGVTSAPGIYNQQPQKQGASPNLLTTTINQPLSKSGLEVNIPPTGLTKVSTTPGQMIGSTTPGQMMGPAAAQMKAPAIGQGAQGLMPMELLGMSLPSQDLQKNVNLRKCNKNILRVIKMH